MDLVFFTTLTSIFLLINGKIVLSDVQEKKIPNKQLLFLLCILPFFYGFLFFTDRFLGGFFSFLIQIIVSILVSFLLYYHGVWSAGDAKYLLVLSLFLPINTTVAFVGNIALITMAYLAGYYAYFYGRFLFRDRIYQKSFFVTSARSQKDALMAFLKNSETNTLDLKGAAYKCLKFLSLFLILFVSMRLLRQYILQDIQSIEFVKAFYIKYPTYSFLIIGAFLLGSFLILQKGILKIKTLLAAFFSKKQWIVDLDIVFISMLFLGLVAFIVYEFTSNPTEIAHKLFLVFTVYLAIYLVFRVLQYSYKLTFQIGEQHIISIDDLKKGDIVDRDYIIKLFGTQKCLGYDCEDKILSPNPQEYFQKMENPIDEEGYNILKQVYSTVNLYHEEQGTVGYQKTNTIKTLKTFPFGVYIFTGFIITYTIGETPIRLISEGMVYVFRMFH